MSFLKKTSSVHLFFKVHLQVQIRVFIWQTLFQFQSFVFKSIHSYSQNINHNKTLSWSQKQWKSHENNRNWTIESLKWKKKYCCKTGKRLVQYKNIVTMQRNYNAWRNFLNFLKTPERFCIQLSTISPFKYYSTIGCS